MLSGLKAGRGLGDSAYFMRKHQNLKFNVSLVKIGHDETMTNRKFGTEFFFLALNVAARALSPDGG